MAEYALIDAKTGDILKSAAFDAKPPDPTGKGWKWVPVEITDPPVNQAIQVKTGPVVTTADAKDKVTRVWTVRDKTTQELADEAAAKDGAELDAALSNPKVQKFFLALTNRVLALENKSPVTGPQLRAYIANL